MPVQHGRNMMAHAQKPDLVFQRNGRVHLNRRWCQFSRLLAGEGCGSADSDCIGRVPTYSARLLATHSIRIFLLHFPSPASPCAIRFQTRYTKLYGYFTVAVVSSYLLSASSRDKWLSVGAALWAGSYRVCLDWPSGAENFLSRHGPIWPLH